MLKLFTPFFQELDPILLSKDYGLKYRAIGLILPQTPTDFFFKDINPQRLKKKKKKEKRLQTQIFESLKIRGKELDSKSQEN